MQTIEIVTAEDLQPILARLKAVEDINAAQTARLVKLETPPQPAPAPVPTPVPAPVSNWGTRTGFKDTPAWQENFDVDATAGTDFWAKYGKTMTAYPETYNDTSGRGYYSPNHLYVKDGSLRVPMFWDAAKGKHCVGAPVAKFDPTSTSGWPNVAFGRFCMEFKISNLMVGYKTATLLWPKSNSSKIDGELDLPEFNFDGSPIGGFFHRTDGQPQYWAKSMASPLSWHTTEILWTPQSVTYLLDGQPFATRSVTTPWTGGVPQNPMHWVWQCETILDTTKAIPTTSKGEVMFARAAYFPLA